MVSTRDLVRAGTAMAMATAIVMGSAFADEIFGIITKVEPAAKKITVVEKKTDKESVLVVADDAVFVSAKDQSESKVDLQKLEDRIARAKQKNAAYKGITAKITHEGDQVSKIEAVAKKKAAAQSE